MCLYLVAIFTLAFSHARKLPSRILVVVHFVACSRSILTTSRITSYNVCYTKLLRTAGLFNAETMRNTLLLTLMSVIWIGSFILYGVGATRLGEWGTVIGWSVYLALSILAASAWGIFQGEWAGSSRNNFV